MRQLLIFWLILNTCISYSQTFYFGNDLSYVNEMEDCGAVYKENGLPKDVYQIFADHGTNLVRVRLWNNPNWQNSLVQPDGVKAQYSDLEDVKETISRSKKAGMEVLLDIHLSDFWTDPGKQLIPSVWIDVAYDTAALADSVYNYVFWVLSDLKEDTLTPALVQIGNETNSGILIHTILNDDYSVGGAVSTSWKRHARLYNAAIKAVRDFSETSEVKPKICLHYAGIQYVSSWCQNLINNGVTDFDIIGLSYYYSWHGGSISLMGNTIRSMKSTFPAYDVMIVETGYLWSTLNFDLLENIIVKPDPAYLPVCPEKQFEYMFDYTREVMNAGGIGVVFWEPAWVSTPCRTLWGQGSSHDHVAFFDPDSVNFMENGGGRWTEATLYSHPEYKKVKFRVSNEDTSKIYITGTMSGDPWRILPMYKEGSKVFNWVTYLPEGDSGAFYFLNDSSWSYRETVPAECAAWWGTDRGYKVGSNDTVISYKWASCQSIDAPENIKVTFKVDMTGSDITNGVWITGSMTGTSWKIIKMIAEGNNIYTYATYLHPGDSGAYYFMNDNVWGQREHVPSECATWWNSDRGYKIGQSDTILAFTWGTCLPLGSASNGISDLPKPGNIVIYPNPVAENEFTINGPDLEGESEISIIDLTGRKILSQQIHFRNQINMETSLLPGTYFIVLKNQQKIFSYKLIIK
jgi:arabinogalactan endo-1,4-beta-galactosidase